MEHEKKQESNIISLHNIESNKNAGAKSIALQKSCSNKSVGMTSDKVSSNHLGLHDDFSMQVTGKQHIYLNTGVTYIEFKDVQNESKNNALNSES